jgi:hypothetical protein
MFVLRSPLAEMGASGGSSGAEPQSWTKSQSTIFAREALTQPWRERRMGFWEGLGMRFSIKAVLLVLIFSVTCSLPSKAVFLNVDASVGGTSLPSNSCVGGGCNPPDT